MAERKKMQWNSMLDGTPNYTGGWGPIEDVDAGSLFPYTINAC